MSADDQPLLEHACSQCRKPFPVEELLTFEGRHLCAACKPHFFQRLRESGVSAQSVGTGGKTPVMELVQLTRERVRGQRLMVLGPFILGGFLAGVVLSGIAISAAVLESELAFFALFAGAALCLVGPMLVGLCRGSLGISRAEDADLALIFSGFSNFVRNFKISLWGTLLVVIYGLVASLFLGILEALWFWPIDEVVAVVVSLTLGAGMAVGSLLYAYPILMAVLVAVDEPKRPPWDCLREGCRLLRGKGFKLLGMHLKQALVFVIPLVIMAVWGAFQELGIATIFPWGIFLGLCTLEIVIACFVVPALVIGTCVFYDDLQEPEID